MFASRKHAEFRSFRLARRALIRANIVLSRDREDNAGERRRLDMSTETLPKIRKASFKIDTSKSREWLKAHRHEYAGKWVVLDGDRLIGAGDDPAAHFRASALPGS